MKKSKMKMTGQIIKFLKKKFKSFTFYEVYINLFKINIIQIKSKKIKTDK